MNNSPLRAVPLVTVCSVSGEGLTLDAIRRVKEVLMAENEIIEIDADALRKILADRDREAEPKRDWMSTVPHPLVQMDEELHQ